MITKKHWITEFEWTCSIFIYINFYSAGKQSKETKKTTINETHLLKMKKRENEAAAHLSPALWLWCGSAAQESGSCHPTGGRQRSQQRLLQDDRCEGNVTGSCPKPAESSSSLLIQTPSLCLPEEQQTTWLKATVHPEMKTCSEQIWRNVSLNLLLINGCSAVNGCHQNESPNSWLKHHNNPQVISSPSDNVLWSEKLHVCKKQIHY